MTAVPTNAAERKALPIFSGVMKYFPDALLAVAACSKAGNDQHNPGKPLHWDRSKSGDELDALTRHLVDAGTIDTDGIRHSTKVAWRALANLQKEIEAAKAQALCQDIRDALKQMKANSGPVFATPLKLSEYVTKQPEPKSLK